MKMAPLDVDQVDEIAGIEATDGDSHWTREHFEKELTGEFRRFFVAQEDESPDILGYGGYWKAGPEAQITNLVVRKASRCQGIGRRILEFILDCARSELCETCTLEVRATNAHAQALYKSLGFEIKGKRPKIYHDPIDDAVLMEKKL